MIKERRIYRTDNGGYKFPRIESFPPVRSRIDVVVYVIYRALRGNLSAPIVPGSYLFLLSSSSVIPILYKRVKYSHCNNLLPFSILLSPLFRSSRLNFRLLFAIPFFGSQPNVSPSFIAATYALAGAPRIASPDDYFFDARPKKFMHRAGSHFIFRACRYQEFLGNRTRTIHPQPRISYPRIRARSARRRLADRVLRRFGRTHWRSTRQRGSVEFSRTEPLIRWPRK